MKKKIKMKIVSPIMSKNTKIVALMMKNMIPRVQGQRQLIKRKIMSYKKTKTVSLVTVNKLLTIKEKE